jgi:hypothetical protein
MFRVVIARQCRTFSRWQRCTRELRGQTGTFVPPRNVQERRATMLFWIAAIGSTWGAYALGFERLVGSDRPELRHGGRKHRSPDDRRTENGAR